MVECPVNIFSEAAENALSLFRSTLSLFRDKENGNIWAVSFITNRGKGSGAQVLPADELADLIQAMKDVVKDGIPEEGPEGRVPAAEMFRRTVQVEDGIVSFRLRSGKGSKPARIPLADFAAWVSQAEGAADQVATRLKNLK